MWLQTCVLMVSFFLSSVLGGITEKGFKCSPAQITVNCGYMHYSTRDLHKAAYSACSQYDRYLDCRNNIKCPFGRLSILMKDPTYKGHLFQDQRQYSLLKWTLPKKAFWKRENYHAIIAFIPESKTCLIVGAIRSTVMEKMGGHVPCYTKVWSEAESAIWESTS